MQRDFWEPYPPPNHCLCKEIVLSRREKVLVVLGVARVPKLTELQPDKQKVLFPFLNIFGETKTTHKFT